MKGLIWLYNKHRDREHEIDEKINMNKKIINTIEEHKNEEKQLISIIDNKNSDLSALSFKIKESSNKIITLTKAINILEQENNSYLLISIILTLILIIIIL